MGSIEDHRRQAEACVAMAQRSDADADKVLWLTLAQSWVRLAEDVARCSGTDAACPPGDGPEVSEAASADRE